MVPQRGRADKPSLCDLIENKFFCPQPRGPGYKICFFDNIQVQKTLRIAVLPCIEKIFIIKLLFEVPIRKVYRWVFLQIEIQSHMVKLNTLYDCGLEISKKNYTQLCKIERDMTHILWGENYVYSGLNLNFLAKFALILTSKLETILS